MMLHLGRWKLLSWRPYHYGFWLGRNAPSTPGAVPRGRFVEGPVGVPEWIGDNRVLWSQVWWRLYRN